MNELSINENQDWFRFLDCYTIQNIVEYFDVDTRLIMRRIDKQIDVHIPKLTLLDGACICSNKIMDCAISKGDTYWNSGLYGACQGGNRDLVNLMIAKGATHWNVGLLGACIGGHIRVRSI